MSAPRAKNPTPAPPPEKRVHIVPRPEQIQFRDMFRIKAATGVDVLQPETYAHALAACLWFALLGTPDELTWADAQTWDLDHVDFEDETDEPLPEDGSLDDDPTHGSVTPTSGSSSPSSPEPTPPA